MKRMLLVLSSMILAVSLTAAKLPIQKGQHGYKILSNKGNSLDLEYRISDLNLTEVKTEKGLFTSVHMNKGYLSDKVGAPAEPEFHNLIEIPLGATAEVEILGYDEQEIDLGSNGYSAPLMPAQPSYSKDVKASEIYTRYNEADYKSNQFTRHKIVEATISGSSRGRTLASLAVRPTRYNPTNNRLIVINNLRVRVKFNGGVANARESIVSHYSPYFGNEYIINPTELTKTEYNDLVKSPVTYLIVANSTIQSTPAMNSKLEEFIKWKTEKGFKVLTNFVSASTPTTAIDEWIETQYNTLTPKPSFVLIVGDHDGSYGVLSEVDPSFGSAGDVTRSDLLYGVVGPVTDANHIPSMYVGRFSVRSAEDLAAQVDKTIYYEKTQFTSNADLSYLSRCMVVAGKDASNQAIYGNPHVRYAMAYHFNDTFTNPVTTTTNGITGIGHLNGATGQEANIINQVSQGVAYYNYTAHGSETSFGDPGFEISDINSLTNTNKYGLVIGNCCLTGSFGTVESFGEAWLNAPNKGAIGYIGSSMSTYWGEDLAMGIGSEAAGDVNSGDITPPFTPDAPGMPDGLMLQKFPTQAGVKHVGLLAVETYGGQYRNSYWSAYHLFGDPSVMIYAGEPKVMTVSHMPTLTPGATSFSVTAVKNAYVALSDQNGVLHGAALADANGIANIAILPFTTGPANLVVYAPMKKPVFKQIPVAAPDGPYMVYNHHNVINNNFGQNCTIDLRLKNIGIATSSNLVVTATVDPADTDYAAVTSNPVNYGNIAAGDSVMKTAAITVAIPTTVPDQEEIKINLAMVDSYTKKTYEGSITFKANAPVLTITHNLTGGGPNAIPGSQRTINYKIKNSGHVDLANTTAELSQTTAANVAIGISNFSLGTLSANDSVTVSSLLTFGADIPLNTVTSYKYRFLATNVDKSYTHNIVVSLEPDTLLFENFENTWAPTDWTTSGTTTANYNWKRDDGHTSGGVYSPTGANNSTHSARYRSYMAPENSYGELVTKTFSMAGFSESIDLTFWYINQNYSSGNTDKMEVFFSTNNGSTWSSALATCNTEEVWKKFTVSLNGQNSATCKLKFKSTSDYGYTDIGLDQVAIIKPASAINETKKPLSSTLFQNYPNPFNPETTIKFYNHENAMVKLAVYNMKGELVANLVNNTLGQGMHNYSFNATALASGVYIYKLQIGNQSMVKSMLLLK